MTGSTHRLTKLLREVAQRAQTRRSRRYQLGGHSLDLPAGHLLDWYRLRHRRYDEPVADICAILSQKYGRFEAIDIGANIGATAALMTRNDNVRVLCVEGNPQYLSLLAGNLARISPTSEIAACYVGATDLEIAGEVKTQAGTAAIEVAASPPVNGARIRLRSLATILDEHPGFRSARLVKVDTDGFDAKIVVGSMPTLAVMRPVLHVEYSPVGEPAIEREYYGMIEKLAENGYRWFHVFDNFGNHMLRLSYDERSHLRELSAYAMSCRRDASPALYYFDICAVTDDDADVSQALADRYASAGV